MTAFRRNTHIGVLLGLVIGTGIGHASNITYQVNQGPLGFDLATVVGTLQTNGAMGALTAADIVAWNIVVTDGLGGSFDLTKSNSSVSLTGTATTATATQLQFNFGSGPPWGTLGDFEILDGSNGWGWALAVPPDTSLEEVLPLGADGDAGLEALSRPRPITIGTVLTQETLQGGTSAEPIFLVGTSVGGVYGTIGSFGSEDYYSFIWGGGPFSASAVITGAATNASYLYSAGVAGSCNSLAALTLDGSDGFASTIFLGNLAAGQYCIGLNANSSLDPAYALTFNTPVAGQPAPEPAAGLLICAGLGMFGVLRRAKSRPRHS